MAKSSGSGKSSGAPSKFQGKSAPHVGFKGVAASAAKEYGSKAAGQRVAGAVEAKIMKNKGK